MSYLQRELWSLGGSVQGLLMDHLPIVGLQHHRVPRLGKAVRWHKVGESL